MPYYNPAALQGPQVQARHVNGFGLFVLVLALAAMGGVGFVYGPSWCGTAVPPSTVLVVAQDGSGQELRTFTGFLISEQGYILTTAAALSDGEPSLQVVFGSGTGHSRTVDAKPVRSGPEGGARWLVLQIDPQADVRPATINDSTAVRKGDRVSAVFYPTEAGTVRARSVAGPVTAVTQADIAADIAPEDEATPGGPLLDASGGVVGLLTDTTSGAFSAVPTADLVDVWQQFVGSPDE